MKHSKSNPIVTIYITSYNYAQYIEKAIQSVIDQTYTNYELIIIDDGSTDGSKEIINQYKKENIFSVFQKNRGLNASNNVALKMSRGKYIIRLDADDYFSPQAIEIMVSELERNSECALVFPDYYHINEDGKIIEEIKRHNFEKDVTLLDQPAHGACTMIRSKILKSIGGYDEEFNRQDGYDIWLKISKLHRVKNVSLPLFYYRKHQKNLTKDETRLFKTRTDIIEKNVKSRNIENSNILAIIPVRGKMIDPNSNPLHKINNKCLIEWTIDSAIESNLLQDVVITSSDHELKEYVCSKYSGRVIWIERNEVLSSMNTGVEKTAIEAIRAYEKNNKIIDAALMLYIEYPLRSKIYIDQAIRMFQLFDVDSVSSVRNDDDMFYVHSGHGLEPWHKSRKLRLERDNLYRRAGGIHLIKKETLFRNQDMLHGKMGHVVVDQKSAFKVQSILDFQLADIIATNDN